MALGYANFSLNVITDLAFALLIPIPMLWSINATRRTQISLFGVLGLGCFAYSCAIVRFVYIGTYKKHDD
jgi:hypothetical protein